MSSIKTLETIKINTTYRNIKYINDLGVTRFYMFYSCERSGIQGNDCIYIDYKYGIN